MQLTPILRCGSELNFEPRQAWPEVLPPVSWRGQLLCGFGRMGGDALDLGDKLFLDVWRACHPHLGLAELARARQRLESVWPELYLEVRYSFFSSYNLRWCDRLDQVLEALNHAPFEFQNLVDEKSVSVRELAPLLSVNSVDEIEPLLKALTTLTLSRFELSRALELAVELYLMGRPLNDLLPTVNNGGLYVRRLEQWRKPESSQADEEWRRTVRNWPWPAQVKAEWQRFGDQAGLEVKIRTTSPADFQKKLENLLAIPDSWSCKS